VAALYAAASSTATGTTAAGKPLTAQDQDQVSALKKRDAEVKAHEKAHQTAGGPYAGAASYTYQQGPDGKQYAIGGEVNIDASPIPNNPKATAAKMQVVQKAALAPAQPSSQDLHVAAEAATALSQAQTDEAKAANAARTGTGTGTGSTGTGQGAATAVQAQALGSASSGTGTSGTGATGAANTSAATITATAAAAQDGGGSTLRALFARGLAAYNVAAGLGGTDQSSSQFAAVA